MHLGAGFVSRAGARQVATPRLRNMPKSDHDLAFRLSQGLVFEEVAILKEKWAENRKVAYQDKGYVLLQKIKLICVNAFDLMITAGKIVWIAFRYFPGVIYPKYVFGNDECSNPPGFQPS